MHFHEFDSIEQNKRKKIEILKKLGFGSIELVRFDSINEKNYKVFTEDHCVLTHLIMIYKKIPSNFGEDFFFSISIHKMR